MHPGKLLEAMAVHGSAAKERPQAQMLPYSAEASAQHCPTPPLNVTSSTGNPSFNIHVATGTTSKMGFCPAEVDQHQQVLL